MMRGCDTVDDDERCQASMADNNSNADDAAVAAGTNMICIAFADAAAGSIWIGIACTSCCGSAGGLGFGLACAASCRAWWFLTIVVAILPE